jgi:hypothetical protein
LLLRACAAAAACFVASRAPLSLCLLVREHMAAPAAA